MIGPYEFPLKFVRTNGAQSFRAGFRQNGLFADFYFWATGFFRGFSRRIFLLTFVGKSAPGKSSKIYTTKVLQHISADWPGQKVL